MENEKIKKYTIDEAVNYVARKLDKEKSLTKFAEKHGFHYPNLLRIKNQKATEFPKLVKKLLVIYGEFTEIEEQKIFICKK